MLALAAANRLSARPWIPRSSRRMLDQPSGRSTTTTGLVTQQTDPNLMSFTWQSTGRRSWIRQPVLQGRSTTSAPGQRLTGTLQLRRLSRATPDLQNSGDARGFPAPRTESDLLGPSSDWCRRPPCDRRCRRILVNELRGGARWSPSNFGLPDGVGSADLPGHRRATRWLLARGATGWTTTNAPSFRNAWNVPVRRFADVAACAHTASAPAARCTGGISRSSTSRRCRRSPSAWPPSDPSIGAVHDRKLSRAPRRRNSSTAAALFATLTGRVKLGRRAARPRSRYRTDTRGSVAAEAARRARTSIRPIVQDAWRRDADPHPQRRRPLAGADARGRPMNDILSQATLRGRVRHLRHQDASGQLPLLPAGRVRRPGARRSRRSTEGSTGYTTDWNNFAPNVGVAWRPNVQGGAAAALSLAIPIRRPSAAATRSNTTGRGWEVFTGIVRRESRAARCR